MISDDDGTPTEYRHPTFAHVTLQLVAGAPTTGLWCDTCLLPSRVEAAVYVLGADGPVRVGIVRRCMEHSP